MGARGPIFRAVSIGARTRYFPHFGVILPVVELRVEEMIETAMVGRNAAEIFCKCQSLIMFNITR
jgi:hypothetical protein